MRILFLNMLCLFLMGCASRKAEQAKIQDKVSQESTIASGKALLESIHEVINSSETLKSKQKDELHKLLLEVRTKNKTLTEESFKLKSVLMKELVAEKINHRQVKLLKKNIRNTESMKLNNILDSVDKIIKIVARDPERQMFMDHMLYLDRPYR